MSAVAVSPFTSGELSRPRSRRPELLPHRRGSSGREPRGSRSSPSSSSPGRPGRPGRVGAGPHQRRGRRGEHESPAGRRPGSRHRDTAGDADASRRELRAGGGAAAAVNLRVVMLGYCSVEPGGRRRHHRSPRAHGAAGGGARRRRGYRDGGRAAGPLPRQHGGHRETPRSSRSSPRLPRWSPSSRGPAAGVNVALGGGEIGGGANIRIRGASSISLNSQPLVYVDGVRVNGGNADRAGASAASAWTARRPPRG